MSPNERDPGPGVAEGALNRAAAILDAFDQAHRELTLATLVRRSGLPRSTVHRTAARMLELGWLDKPADRYRIGNRLFELSGLAPIRHELRETVLPFLQDLYHAVHTTVQLGVLDGAQVLIVEKITGHRAMPMLSQVGGTVPTHCSALGRTLLAYSAPEVVDTVLGAGMVPRTSRTITSPAALRTELAGILERGWAVDAEEGNVGVSCVAAPVFGPLGDVVAAMSATGPTELVRPDRAGPTVRLAAAGASRAWSRRG
jgi:DNA-binding IclR family transcriptional regulator